jgi:hypothetical protein
MFSRTLKRTVMPMVGVGMLHLYQQSKTKPACAAQSSALQSNNLRKLSPYRPNDWLHLYYAAQVYQNTGGLVLQGWELVHNFEDDNGYYGKAYRNTNHHHVIIAYCSVAQGLKDSPIDLELITKRLAMQESSAWNDFARKLIEEQGPKYTYSFTGHSLGGWLAQACLWKYQDEFVKDKSYQDGLAVTLDNPGTKKLFEILQPRETDDYRIDIGKLDITTYLSRPNIINTASGHVGSVYALCSDMESSWPGTLGFNDQMNPSILLKKFDKETGLPIQCYRVLDWPIVVWGKTISNSKGWSSVLGSGNLPQAIKAYLSGDINLSSEGWFYKIEALQPQILPLRNMPYDVCHFLEELSNYPNRSEIVNALIGHTIEPELALLLNAYKINEREECVLDTTITQVSAWIFRERLLKFLSNNPLLYQTKLTVLRMQYIEKQIQNQIKINVDSVLTALREQVQFSSNLVHQVCFVKGTARANAEPTWENMKETSEDILALKTQREALKTLKENLEILPLEPKSRDESINLIQQHDRQLQIVIQSTIVLANSMEAKRQRLIKDKEFMHAVAEDFRRILSEKINISLYTDRAIWNQTAKLPENSFDKLLEVAQLVSGLSDEITIRIATNLGVIYAKGKVDEYRRNQAGYIQKFNSKSITEKVSVASGMIAERYKEQLFELSAEGLEDFTKYFHDKLIENLRKKYKHNLNNSSEKTIPIEREFFEIMINPNEGPSIPLQKKLSSKENIEINSDKEECWNSRELVEKVGIVIERKYFGRKKEEENNDSLYELKPKDKKYGKCFGDKSDISDPRFQRCALWMFFCRPPNITDLKKYPIRNFKVTEKLK